METCVYVFGPCKFYKNSIQYIVKNDIGLPCEVSEGTCIKNVDLGGKNHFQSILCLWDCWEYTIDSLMSNLSYCQNYTCETQKIFIVVYNVRRSSGIEEQALEMNVDGIFYEDDSIDIIKKGIKAVINGELWYSRKVLANFVQRTKKNPPIPGEEKMPKLTSRENEVLTMMCQGLANNDMAKKLYISTSTVKKHIYSIYQKFNVTNRTQAVLYSIYKHKNNNSIL